jgi:uncharacterized protein (TIGR02466 family)
MEYNVQHILPIAVYRSKIDVNSLIKTIDLSERMDPYNGTLQNASSNLLEQEQFHDLKMECQKHLDNYTQDVMKHINEFYITSSWVNYNPPNTLHALHHHTNSVYSGVVYVRSPKGAAGLIFDKQPLPALSFEVKEYNESNSNSWEIPVEDGDILIFPSNQLHMVPLNTTNQDRITIAFNSFARGDIGYGSGYIKG